MRFVTIIGLVALTLLSGLCDAQGFVHAARVWHNGHIVLRELSSSAAGFVLGIAFYWVGLRPAEAVGIVSVEAQTVGWFGATLIGVALFNREFFRWSHPDQLLGIVTAFLLGALLYRTSR